MRLLLISNSTNPGEPYLDYPKNNIRDFLGKKPVKALFIPYAAVTPISGAPRTTISEMAYRASSKVLISKFRTLNTSLC